MNIEQLLNTEFSLKGIHWGWYLGVYALICLFGAWRTMRRYNKGIVAIRQSSGWETPLSHDDICFTWVALIFSSVWYPFYTIRVPFRWIGKALDFEGKRLKD